jgi:DNA-binding NtrC family response regulator
LARHLLAREAKRPLDQVANLLTPEAIDVLLEYQWQGNVRELANAMEYAYIISGGKQILPEHLPHHIRTHAAAEVARPVLARTPAEPPPSAIAPSSSGSRTLREIEMEHIVTILKKHNDHKPTAAAELGISLKTLYNKLNQLEEERRAAG